LGRSLISAKNFTAAANFWPGSDLKKNRWSTVHWLTDFWNFLTPDPGPFFSI
jgi:hypothetical protein